MSDEGRLAEIRAREQAAMSGPWEWDIQAEGSFQRDGMTHNPKDRARIVSSELVQANGEQWVVTANEVTLIGLDPLECDGETETPIYAMVAAAPDADFIAHARQDIPYLLEQLDAARTGLAEAERREQGLREALTVIAKGVWIAKADACLDTIGFIAREGVKRAVQQARDALAVSPAPAETEEEI